MASKKLPHVLMAALVAVVLSPVALRSDDTLPPPPPGDALPPPPGMDAGAPPPPGMDAGAPPAPGADLSAPPAPDASTPPPPGMDASTPPPPGMDAGAPPAPGADASMPPPPGADAGALPPPDASAPPAAPAAPGGDLLPPPAAPDAAAPSAPAPTGGDLQPPPADNLFPDGSQAASTSGHKSGHGHGGKVTHYRVAHHDSLWKISAKSKIYGDPFQWPVLFIANRQKIKDPDLIKPGQDLKVKRDLGSEQVNSAIQKAKDTPRYEPHTTAREKLPIEY